MIQVSIHGRIAALGTELKEIAGNAPKKTTGIMLVVFAFWAIFILGFITKNTPNYQTWHNFCSFLSCKNPINYLINFINKVNNTTNLLATLILFFAYFTMS